MIDSRPDIYLGVNAQGNGHIARMRPLAVALRAAGAEVKCLFSGRDRKDFFNMAAFGPDFEVRRGIRMHQDQSGGVNLPRSILDNAVALPQLLRDIKELNFGSATLALTDYEPIVPRAAKRQGIPSVGIANHYAFNYAVPRGRGHTKMVDAFILNYAPADVQVGMYLHHFGQPVLPPIFEPPASKAEKDPKKILVYLGFENLMSVKTMLKDFRNREFHVYHPHVKTSVREGHLWLKPPSAQFREDMADCSGLITGGGFAAPLEALHLGIPLLVKPQDGQPEQASTARALEVAQWGSTMYELDGKAVGKWLGGPPGVKVTYPDTAAAFADWLINTDRSDIRPLARKLWAQVPGVGAPAL